MLQHTYRRPILRNHRAAKINPWQRKPAYLRKASRMARLAPLAIAATLAAFAVLDGANNGFLAALLAMAQCLFASFTLLMTPSAPRALRQAWPVTATVAAIAIWAALPAFGAMIGHGGPLTPDLYRLSLIALYGQLVFLLSMIVLAEHPVFMRRFTNTLALILIPALLLPLLKADWLPVPPDNNGRFHASFHNPNVAAVVFAMASLVATGVAIGRFQNWLSRPTDRGLFTMIGAGLMALVGGCTVLATQSRTGSGLFLGAEALLLAMALGFSKSGGPARWMRVTAACAVLLTLAGAGALIFVNRFELLASDSFGRIAVWHNFSAIAAKAPLTGYGLGSFAQLNLETLTPQTASTFWDFGAAHASPLQLVMEMGVPGLLLVLALIGVLLRPIVKHPRLPRDPVRLSMLLAAGLATGASMVDIAMNVPIVCALVISLIAALYGRSTASEE